MMFGSRCRHNAVSVKKTTAIASLRPHIVRLLHVRAEWFKYCIYGKQICAEIALIYLNGRLNQWDLRTLWSCRELYLCNTRRLEKKGHDVTGMWACEVCALVGLGKAGCRESALLAGIFKKKKKEVLSTGEQWLSFKQTTRPMSW